MKKLLVWTILFTILFSMPVDARVVGSYVHTDIVAYINGLPIPSYNIDGWTGIVAEDLRDYGFDVYWSGEERTLYISHDFFPYPEYTEENLQGDGQITATYIPAENTKPIGSFAGHIYATDIKTYVAGDLVHAYNIDGRTIILMDELSRLGDVIWHPDTREIRYAYVPAWSIDLYQPNYEADTTKPIQSFSLSAKRQEDNTLITEGEHLDYLTYPRLYYSKKDGMCFGFSLYQRVLFQTVDLNTLLWDISTQSYDGTTLSQTADKANQHMEIIINGQPVTITRVTQGKGNGHSDFYFWFDLALRKEQIDSVSVHLQ